MNTNLQDYLIPTFFLDFESTEVQSFIRPFKDIGCVKKRAISLYDSVRDKQLYDPFHLDLRPKSLKSSFIISKKRAWCVEKSILMASSARALGIPSKLGFAIVENHLNIDKLEKYLRKKEIVFHGYVSLYLDNKWVRCTPAFDRAVCRISKVPVLEFDGTNDSLFQAFINSKAFMEYRFNYGEFSDLPLDLMKKEMQNHYPHLFSDPIISKDFSFIY